MRMYDLISKKRNGGALNREEMTHLIEGYVKGEIPDYQMAAFLMAVYFQGMNHEETTMLTMAMADRGAFTREKRLSWYMIASQFRNLLQHMRKGKRLTRGGK